MDVLHGFDDRPERARGSVLAIGNFDGIHRGHQALIETAKSHAARNGTDAGVMIFEPHPREFFHPEDNHFRLTPLQEKLRLFEKFSLGFTVVMSFDETLANLSADDFCKHILADRLQIREAVIGYDFFFGKGRSGTPEMLKAAGETYGYRTTIVAPVAEDGEAFSSTAIRLKLAQGDVKSAAHALGRWWQVHGKVIGGAHRGAGLGFPTANIPLPKGTGIAHGIYAVRVTIDGTQHDGAAYLGTRPTFDDGRPVLEVFVFDFDGDLYDAELAVEFIEFLRSDRKFDSPDALVKQMQADCAAARGRLAAAPATPI